MWNKVDEVLPQSDGDSCLLLAGNGYVFGPIRWDAKLQQWTDYDVNPSFISPTDEYLRYWMSADMIDWPKEFQPRVRPLCEMNDEEEEQSNSESTADT